MTDAQNNAENAGQIIRHRGGESVEVEGGKVARGGASNPKDVKNEGRSGNVYENKGRGDNLADAKDDISARLHAILHRNRRILQEPSSLLLLFER
jgi:hypothetical protein